MLLSNVGKSFGVDKYYGFSCFLSNNQFGITIVPNIKHRVLTKYNILV